MRAYSKPIGSHAILSWYCYRTTEIIFHRYGHVLRFTYWIKKMIQMRAFNTHGASSIENHTCQRISTLVRFMVFMHKLYIPLPVQRIVNVPDSIY
jgi:hypothetical protein